MEKAWWLPFVFLVVTLLSLLDSAPTVAAERVLVPGGSYMNITPAELAGMLEKKDFFFVNVHIPYEGEIAGTDAHIPFNQIEQNLKRFPQDKKAKMLVYCRSGSMSTAASQTLVRLGYTNLFHLSGGMQAWKKAGYPLLDKGKGE